MKSPPWLLVAEGEIEDRRRVTLDPAEARHATGALRLSSGDPVVLTDGVGRVATGAITLPGRGVAEVMIQTVDRQPVPASGLALAIGVLAGAAMDLVVQKAVELGVERLIPVCCERSQMAPKRALTRSEHWRRISRQALKQCHRAWAMELAQPVGFAEFVADPTVARGAVAHTEGGPVEGLPVGRDRLLLVGPEGGFSRDEEQVLETSGWPRVCLGPHILRAETAAIAGAAVFISLREELHSNDG